MRHRWIQNLCIIIIFLIAFVAIIAMGMMQGKKSQSLQETGLPLDEKTESERSEEIPSILLTDDSTVYVTESGKKYHIFHDCSSLARSTKIIGTTYKNAQDEGKELCTYCKSRNEK